MSEKPPDKVTLIVLKRTRQVVAVATRQVVPETALPLSEDKEKLAQNAADELKVLVGNSLVVRDLVSPTSGSPLGGSDRVASGVAFSVSELDVITVDQNPNEFKIKNARSFVIDGERKLTPGADPTSPATAITMHATTDHIRVGLADAPAQAIPVTIQIFRDDGSKPQQTVEGEIKRLDLPLTSPPTGASVDIAVSLASGEDYHFVALVQGYKPAVHAQQI